MVLLLGPLAGHADPAPRLVLIIDDLGDALEPGLRAVFLPGRITVGILPETPYARLLALAANSAGQEAILHVPMSNVSNARLGPAALTSSMQRDEMQALLRLGISGTPHIRGINNHMGSALTSNPDAMGWVMEEVARHQLYFIDSRTSTSTVAAKQAAKRGIPHLSRDIFLDNELDEASLERQLQAWTKKARQRGYAVAIAHPYQETLAFLELRLIELVSDGYQLVHPSEVIASFSLAGVATETSLQLQ